MLGQLPSGLPIQVGGEEDLVRLLNFSNWFSSLAQMPKPAAFLPNPKDRETSVFRQSAEPLASLRGLGVAQGQGRKIYGVAMFKAALPRALGLEVVASEPPDRHASLRGWPWDEDDPQMQKGAQKEIALQLASEAVLLLW